MLDFFPVLSQGLRHLVAAVSMSLAASAALAAGGAATGTEAAIKAAVERNTQGKVRVDSVSPSAIPGLYEVVSGQDVLYVDPTGRYGIDGQLIDMQQQRDLTEARREQLLRIRFSDLPLDLALKRVQGNGKRVLAVFEDPGCGVCRALTKFLDQLPDVTVYRFMYPISGDGALRQAQAAWCARDRQQAWSSVMRGGELAPPSAGCDLTGLSRIQQLGDRLRVNNTPTVFLSDGRRLIGATPPDQFIAALDSLGR
jgi:thiol:disulfide interchange protein DsbC